MIKKKKKKNQLRKKYVYHWGLVLLNKQGVIIAVDANADNLRAAVWNNDTLVTSTSFRKGNRFLNMRHFSDLNINGKMVENVNFKCVFYPDSRIVERIPRLRNITLKK